MRKLNKFLMSIFFVLAMVCLVGAIVMQAPLQAKYSVMFFGYLFFAASAVFLARD